MIKTKQIFAYVAIVSFIVVSFVGCDSGNDTPQSQPKVYAGTNSTFTYKKTYKDANGNPQGADTTKTATVVQGPHSYAGKDTTITVVEDARDTTIMSYEANGDVALYRGNGIPGSPLPIPVPSWWTLPVKSKISLQIMNLDTTATFNFGSFSVTLKKVQGNANPATDTTITVNGESLVCQRADVTFVVNAMVSILPVTLTFKTTYFFSAKLGYFAAYDTHNTFPELVSSQIDPGNSIQVLTSYSIK
jgi:hypothetical protein